MTLCELKVGTKAPNLVGPKVQRYGHFLVADLLTAPVARGVKLSDVDGIWAHAGELPTCNQVYKLPNIEPSILLRCSVVIGTSDNEHCDYEKRSHTVNSDSNSAQSQGAA